MENVRQVVSPDVNEPNPPIYSNCLAVGNQLFISGMTAGDGKGGIVGDGSAYSQAWQCFDRIKKLVEVEGGTLKDVVKLTLFVTDMSSRPEVGRARNEFFSGRMPCSTLVEVGSLAQPGLTVEIEATAFIGAG